MDFTLPMRAKNLADAQGLRVSTSQHEMMIDLLAGNDIWAFAQLCVEYMQSSKKDYLNRFSMCANNEKPEGIAPLRQWRSKW